MRESLKIFFAFSRVGTRIESSHLFFHHIEWNFGVHQRFVFRVSLRFVFNY